MSLDLDDVPSELREAVAAALEAAKVFDGHLAIELVAEDRIQELNGEHRRIDRPTDVLAFPLDGVGAVDGPRELGDVFICPEQCTDVREAAVHGTLHLCGYDHEKDEGQMLGLQDRVMHGLVGSLASGHPSQGTEPGSMTRAGFVGMAGRPNVGKSTLTNAIVGAKVAITADRPQTTRRAIRGISTDVEAGWQLILVDLPGVQRPRDALTQRMQRRVERELASADAVVLVVNAEEGIGAGDRFIANTLLRASNVTRSVDSAATGVRPPVICAVNKVDRLGPGATAAVLDAAAQLPPVDEVFPVSAKQGTGLQPLIERLGELMPAGPMLYPPEDRTDAPSEILLGELIREQVLRRTREELPHAVEVSVTDIERREDGLVTVKAQIWAETESQRSILVGRGGRMVGDIGKAARKELERELGTQVYLDLQVQSRGRWRRDDGLLDRLGIE